VPGSQELLVIALVALFVLGPERLPGLARSAARGLTKLRNYGVTASKELRGVADLGEIEREVSDLRRELARTRADLRRAMRDTVASSPSSSRPTSRSASQPSDEPEAARDVPMEDPAEDTTDVRPEGLTGDPGGATDPERDGGPDGAASERGA